MTTTTDRIEREILLKVPRARAWRALADADEFGAWFGVKLAGRFEPGARVTGQITHPGYEHLQWEVTIERMDPEALLSFRWHPYAIDPAVDYSGEPTTLVELRLEDAPGGTRLTVTESGFDRIPAGRRDLAFRMNGSGWTAQMENVARHVGG